MRNNPYTTAWAPTDPAELEWRRHAACLNHDPDLFFPTWNTEREWEKARAVCRGCDVAPDCLAFAEAMETAHPGTREGMWGGLTPEERKRAHRNRVRAARQAAALNNTGSES